MFVSELSVSDPYCRIETVPILSSTDPNVLVAGSTVDSEVTRGPPASTIEIIIELLQLSRQRGHIHQSREDADARNFPNRGSSGFHWRIAAASSRRAHSLSRTKPDTWSYPSRYGARILEAPTLLSALACAH